MKCRKRNRKTPKKKKNYQASQNECVSITRIEEKKIVMRQLEMETSSINRDNKKNKNHRQTHSQIENYCLSVKFEMFYVKTDSC